LDSQINHEARSNPGFFLFTTIHAVYCHRWTKVIVPMRGGFGVFIVAHLMLVQLVAVAAGNPVNKNSHHINPPSALFHRSKEKDKL
jgi:hypothetical protein